MLANIDILHNLDLLAVGASVAAMAVLGFTVLLNNRRSITNRTFFLFTIFAVLWSVFNYLYYQFSTPELVLWLLRVHAFFAVWYTFFLYQLFYVFPRDKIKFHALYKFLLIPIVSLTSLLTLTSLVFSKIVSFSPEGRIAAVDNGVAIWLFGALIVGLVVGGFLTIIVRRIRTPAPDRARFSFVIVGGLLTFMLHIAFNLILPAAFDNPRFIPLGAVFIFPFVAFTSYAILKHKLFNIRVAGTAVLVFLLAVVTFLEVIFARNLSLIVYRGSIFILVLTFGIMLIRTVLHEVEQKERLQRLTGELREANEKLKELDRAKTEFVSLGSHQLRAPLTAIKGYVSMIMEGSFGEISDKVREALDVIFQSSQKLVRVIEDFLNITRIELGKMKYDMTTFDLRQLAENVVKEMSSILRNGPKNLVLSFDFQKGKDYVVTADYGKLAQVVSNLIDNAIKYTNEGSVTITLAKTNGPAKEGGAGKNRLTITDTGVGMDQETLANLFQKFSRAPTAGQTNAGGAGLGLYVARQIVEAHGGRIWAESGGVGKGSKFVVEV